MSFTITTAFVQQFSGNIRYLAQQMDSRFRGKVIEDQITGESAYMEQLAPTAARKVTSRNADSPNMNQNYARRRIAPYDYDWGALIDKLDKVRLLIDPTSAEANAGAMAMKRAQDDEVIAAAFATAYTGHSGSTAITWPNADTSIVPAPPAGTVVAVNSWAYGNGTGNTGLTISKLIEAKVALQKVEGDENEEFYFALGAKQLGNLLSTTEATNADYNTVKALVKGELNEFMGFTFVRTERLLLSSTNTRCIAWRKSGLGLGIAQDIDSMVSQRSDKRYAYYAYSDQSIGAARLEEAKVCEVLCA